MWNTKLYLTKSANKLCELDNKKLSIFSLFIDKAFLHNCLRFWAKKAKIKVRQNQNKAKYAKS